MRKAFGFAVACLLCSCALANPPVFEFHNMRPVGINGVGLAVDNVLASLTADGYSIDNVDDRTQLIETRWRESVLDLPNGKQYLIRDMVRVQGAQSRVVVDYIVLCRYRSGWDMCEMLVGKPGWVTDQIMNMRSGIMVHIKEALGADSL